MNGAVSVRRQRSGQVLLVLALLALAAIWSARLGGAFGGLTDVAQLDANPLSQLFGAALTPTFSGGDAQRQQIPVRLEPVANGLSQPTDIQFPPGIPGQAIVLSKGGVAHWLRLDNGVHGELFRVTVLTASEEGLLGLAFHPRFKDSGRFFINYVADIDGKDTSVVAEWQLDRRDDLSKAKAKAVRTLMRVPQPYPNHNAGALAFGPDGYLYVGWGDGGAGGDPLGHGQNAETLLGSMLRIDVDAQSDGKAYGIPKDNPFLGKPGFAPETWAYGLRNPWRYSFDAKGRLIVADVGQNSWEEIDIVQAGDNLGWSIKEGFACFTKQRELCETRKDLVDPVFVYGREDGISITGGYVYRGKRIPALKDLYVAGDFGSGRLFALRLPSDRTQRVEQPIALGKFPIAPSTFGRAPDGELYVASFGDGVIHRLAPE